jgi:hypothetical protein
MDMSNDPSDNTIDRAALRLAAVILLLGALVFLAAGFLHPSREPANNHAAVFIEYAGSAQWTNIHLGQFVGMLVMIAGLLVLFLALNVHLGAPGWLARGGAVSAVVTLALYGVLQAVDGVALKQAVDAYASAPEAEKAARFASAEAIRWLEWGVRSYQDFMLGLTFILFALVVVWTARTPRLIGYLMGLTGIGYIAQGFVTGAEGFSPKTGIPTLASYALWLLWSIWLLIYAWRAKEPGEGAKRNVAIA